ncbi:hypothetical protein HXP44_07185 [Streptomyces sioyaensis]|uniref:Beta/gamma crystallin 'Greek key' domain-containing protein n=1 Tax=Streptomyces sioyaensis TaxID=67364 RepID=A0A4Q1R402_9ACTN|nr:beta/gamma crystallin-related protein [Streptomyces sioyaensis]MBM4791841.1 hypothetical protein [Streptomyces sioyaensis]RXS68194.1 hypothetical protein EST54_09410 [Streptomyces sioyaensis]
MRIRRTAVAGAAAAALTLVAALPASADGAAAAGPLKAGKAKVKIFEQPKFQGRYTVLTHGVRNLPAAGWEHIGSAKNTGKRTATFYEHAGYHGARFSLAPGESEPDFGDVGMGDKTGSLMFR